MRQQQRYIQILCLRNELRLATNSVLDPRNERTGLAAVTKECCTVCVGTRGRGCCLLDGAVGEDAQASAVVGGITAESFNLSTEPVVTRCLVGFDDHLVALADVDHYTLYVNGLNGDEVGCDQCAIKC